jgi:hypothetical protein
LSGIAPAWTSPAPIDLDVHAIPAHAAEAPHEHYDVRFLAVAPPDAVPHLSPESHALRWFTPATARAAGLDASLLRLVDLAFAGG